MFGERKSTQFGTKKWKRVLLLLCHFKWFISISRSLLLAWEFTLPSEPRWVGSETSLEVPDSHWSKSNNYQINSLSASGNGCMHSVPPEDFIFGWQTILFFFWLIEHTVFFPEEINESSFQPILTDHSWNIPGIHSDLSGPEAPGPRFHLQGCF